MWLLVASGICYLDIKPYGRRLGTPAGSRGEGLQTVGGGPHGTFTRPGKKAFGGKPQEALAEVGMSRYSETRELAGLRAQVRLCMSPSEHPWRRMR